MESLTYIQIIATAATKLRELDKEPTYNVRSVLEQQLVYTDHLCHCDLYGDVLSTQSNVFL